VITLHPMCGLGNRMRAIASGVALAREIGRPMRVIWVRSKGMQCRFDALFEPIPGVPVLERTPQPHRILRRFAIHLGKYSHLVQQPDIKRMRGERSEWREIARRRSPYISTYDGFYRCRHDLEIFRPRAPLQREIERTTAGFGPHTVGVHIRRGDHDRARQRSPTAAFIERMAADDLAARFFLATDSPAEESALSSHFPGRVITYRKASGRDSAAGIQGALVELYALARTSRILGSYSSSFSETAAEIGGVTLEVIDTACGKAKFGG
jgi:hypothetical protein